MFEEALRVVKRFNNHIRALGLLREVTIAETSKAPILVLPVISRWASHYLAVTRLLPVRKALYSVVLCMEKELLDRAGTGCRECHDIYRGKSILDTYHQLRSLCDYCVL